MLCSSVRHGPMASTATLRNAWLLVGGRRVSDSRRPYRRGHARQDAPLRWKRARPCHGVAPRLQQRRLSGKKVQRRITRLPEALARTEHLPINLQQCRVRHADRVQERHDERTVPADAGHTCAVLIVPALQQANQIGCHRCDAGSESAQAVPALSSDKPCAARRAPYQVGRFARRSRTVGRAASASPTVPRTAHALVPMPTLPGGNRQRVSVAGIRHSCASQRAYFAG